MWLWQSQAASQGFTAIAAFTEVVVLDIPHFTGKRFVLKFSKVSFGLVVSNYVITITKAKKIQLNRYLDDT